jgi:O-antigen ligase
MSYTHVTHRDQPGGMARAIIGALILAYIMSVLIFSYQEGLSLYTKIVALTLVLSSVYMAIQERRVPRIFISYRLLMFWLCYSTLGLLVAVNQDAFLGKWLTLLQLYPLTILLTSIIVSIRCYELPWVGFIVTTTIISLYSLINASTMSTMDGRLYGTFGNSNMFGLALLVSIIYGIYAVLTAKSQFYRIISLGMLLIFFYTLIQTGSRKAILCVFVIGGGFAVFYVWNLAKRNLGAALVSLFIMIFLTATAFTQLTSSKHYHRFERIFESFQADDNRSLGESEKGRLALLAVGRDTALSNPLIGVGLDNFRFLDSKQATGYIGTYSHSNFIEIAVSTGLIGFTIYYLAFGILFLSCYRRLKYSGTSNEKLYFGFNIFILLMCVIYDFAMVSYYEKVTWLVIAMVVASTYRRFDTMDERAGH